MHLFMTGTGTGVGKTRVTCLMLRALAGAGRKVAGYKPVSCGGREDAEAILAAGSPGPTLDEVNPVAYRSPVAPGVAGRLEGSEAEIDALVAGFRALADEHDHVLVEGAGGWEVPLNSREDMADLAVALGLPVVVVVDNRLGALNHTALTVRAIRARGLTVAGLVLNHLEDERDIASITNRAVLEEWLEVPVLEDILHGAEETDPEWVVEAVGGRR